MKYCKVLVTGILAIHGCIMFTAPNIVTYIPLRSQGLNTPRHLVGLIGQLYTQPFESLYGTINATLFYDRSFDNDTFSQCLFGIKDDQTITISGSQVANRGSNDWLADYFYLPTDFKSHISFKPTIDNIGAEFCLYINLDEWTPGLYFAVYAPIVHSRWDLNMCETVDLKGTNSHAPGYFTPDTLQRNALLNNFTEYINGDLIGPFVQTVGPTNFTIVAQNLLNAKISPDRLARTRLADIRALFGYYFARYDRFRVALQALVVGPVGNRPTSEFLFEPIIGNGHHWEFGASLFGNGILWQSQDEEKKIILTGDISLTHLFAGRQSRIFDLSCQPFSRYMLIERLGTPITNNLKGNGITPSAQFVNEVLPVANLTKLKVFSSFAIQGELTALLTFVCDHFSWDIGYNFWGISSENIKLSSNNPFSNNSKWALKGDAQVFGFDRGVTSAGALVGAVALSATESNATITSGTNLTAGRTVVQALSNPGIDAPLNATGDASGGSNNNLLTAQPTSTAFIATSINPVFLTPASLGICNTTSQGLSSKLFTHFNYAWIERMQWIPYVGFGGEIEIHHATKTPCNTSDDDISCALSQWGIWLKGGMTF